MRRAVALPLLLAAALFGPARAGEVAASAPRDLSVTIYRAPFRGAGGFELSQLGGFALISETRVVSLPAGESRVRFEGVADGIDPASAIVTGLPSGVIEKNRDAHLLSPSALIAMAIGRPVVLVRTHPDKSRARATTVEQVEGRILSDADGGVVFETSSGIEALRCSGLSETFSFDTGTTGLSALPTLSVLTRSPRPLTAVVTLSYLADGFDWSADYAATLSDTGTSLELGAWLTLANANGTSFPAARTQVVAGRLNRSTGEVDPIDRGSPILARCWPRGSTSDSPDAVQLQRVSPLGRRASFGIPPPPAPMEATVYEIVTTAKHAELEQLGDLKLYRTPARTTVASRQAKQVRLLDRLAVPVERVYGAELVSGADRPAGPAAVVLRTRNDEAHHLGLPLPSGRIAISQVSGRHDEGRPLLLGQARTRDLAVDEEVEWRLGPAPDVQVTQTHERRTIDRSGALIPVIPGLLWASSARLDDAQRVEIANAGDAAVSFELRLTLPPGASIVRADHQLDVKDGRPLFRLALAAHTTTVLHYESGRPPVGVPTGAAKLRP